MLEGIKRLFGATAAPARGQKALAAWAETRQYVYRSVRESDGFVVEGRLGAQPWRMEWGPSQRNYIAGKELRLRAELGVATDLQALVMNRELHERMEKDVFDQYVEGVQTRIDTETPPEMRWLVMFPKLSGSELGTLREHFIAVSGTKPWLTSWLDGPLRDALGALNLPPAQPLVLMIGRGRLALRTALDEAEPAELERWVRLFETALREARRVVMQFHDVAGSPSTQPSLWSASAMPPEAGPR